MEAYRIIKFENEFYLQRKCKYLWIDIDSDISPERLERRIVKLENKYKEFLKIKEKYKR